MHVAIPFLSNIDGLSVLLTLLQMQTQTPDKVIVIDNSKDGRARCICRKYRYSVPIDYIPLKKSIYHSWNYAIRLSPKKDIIYLNDDVIIPTNFIEMMKNAMRKKEALSFVPDGPPIDHRVQTIETNKPHFLKSVKHSVRNNPLLVPTRWLKGYCFMLPKKTIKRIGLFDTRFTLWYGDSDYQERILAYTSKRQMMSICKISNLYVYHYGSNSFSLQDCAHIIAKDKQIFDRKYGSGASDAVLKNILDNKHVY